MQNRCDIIKNDAILWRDTKKRCNIGATLKNDAILRRDTKKRCNITRDTKKRCNITSARSQVRGHKNTQISHYLGARIIIDAKSMRH
jgi:hypothetical protein